jgi:hypothetical protein
MHWRCYLDSDVIRTVDLDGREFTFVIKEVKKGKVTGKTGKANGKAMIYFEGREKPVAAGAEALAQIGAVYGNDARKWPGNPITIYTDPNVKYGGEKVGGIRFKAPPADYKAPETKAASNG